ncbi:hypothetical protein, partial [Klebsiella pneumoniae]|uniref:hypothetical protein n=1 Tax=Klebsiella pneumoniae TaxID=573 RepID=UPI002732197F
FDLRIRRRKEIPETYNVIQPFITVLEEKITTITKARQCLTSDGVSQTAFMGDMRAGYDLLKQYAPEVHEKGFNGAIT